MPVAGVAISTPGSAVSAALGGAFLSTSIAATSGVSPNHPIIPDTKYSALPTSSTAANAASAPRDRHQGPDRKYSGTSYFVAAAPG
jgi:hypothetical protein